jgi:hypothetical protein
VTPRLTYHSDDPWNQTAADNAEWLQRFKRDVGIAKDAGPGLPRGYSWSLSQGGSGFAPPYAYPKGNLEPFVEDIEVNMRDGAKPFKAGHDAANHFLETLLSENSRPANVFCSRELEAGLAQFVQENVMGTGCFPTDAALQARAKDILNVMRTAADDPILLAKFKTWMKNKLPGVLSAEEDQQPSLLPANMDVNITDAELGDILNDMDFDFDVDSLETGIQEQDDDVGGVSLLHEPSVYE